MAEKRDNGPVIDHIAIKVSHMESFAAAMEEMGYPMTIPPKQYDEVGMKIAFMGAEGESQMELFEVTSPDSPAADSPEGMHHIAVAVDDIETAHRQMSESPRFEVMGEIRQGAHSRIFFYRLASTRAPLFECTEKHNG